MLSTISSSKKRVSCKLGSDDEGLRNLTKLANGNSNVVIKPIFLLNQTVKLSTNHSAPQDDLFCCYLKSCHLCQKPLSLDKEVYMYRGDLGFCSVECRERQIYLDEKKEIEISTQKFLSSFRQRRRRGGGRCENSNPLEEIRQNSRLIFS